MVESSDTERLVKWLERHGLQEIAAFLLDFTRPLGILGAQAVYMAEPLFGDTRHLLRDLAHILEDPEKVDKVLIQLRREETRDG
ncbi:MAG: hypothetical protein GTO18_20885 [Anaerolineales bacterium]|nr:hypothetical protein [Anaerolineales bacterium]